MKKTSFIIPLLPIILLSLLTGCATEEELAGEAEIITAHNTAPMKGDEKISQAEGKAKIEYLVCKEYDDGRDIYKPAETSSRYEYKGIERTRGFADNCIDENTLKEYYCSNKKLATAIVKCENGCSGNACRK